MTPVLYDGFLHPEERHTCSASVLSLLEVWAPQQICAHISDSASLKAPNIEKCSVIIVSLRTSEHVRVAMFPCYFTAPICANAQSPEAKLNHGAEGAKCLTGGCSVSLCLSHFI